MNQELEKKMVETLDYIGTVVKSGVDLTKSQCPELIKELIQFKTIQNWIGLGVSLLFAGLFIGLFVHGYNLPEVASRDASDVLYMGFGAILSIVCLMCSIGFIVDLVKIKYAPKVYILEYLSYLTTNKE